MPVFEIVTLEYWETEALYLVEAETAGEAIGRIKAGEEDEESHVHPGWSDQSVRVLTVDGEKYVPEPVNLIASGYEWMCPECGTLNHEKITGEEVMCDECSQVFAVGDCSHATQAETLVFPVIEKLTCTIMQKG